MRRRIAIGCLTACVVALFSYNLSAQVVPKSIQEGGSDSVMRGRKNQWTVGIVGGLLSGSYMRFADEMASALNDGDDLRILRRDVVAFIRVGCEVVKLRTGKRVVKAPFGRRRRVSGWHVGVSRSCRQRDTGW